MIQKTGEGDLLDDWKTFVGDFLPRQFNAFELDSNDKPEGYADLVVKAIRTGDPTLVEDEIISNASDYLNQAQDQAFIECRAAFLKPFKDPEVSIEFDGDVEFDSVFNEIYEERQILNALDMVSGLNLLVWNKDMQFSLGWVGDPQDTKTELQENPELDKFDRLSGLSPKQFDELVVNGMDFDVQGIIGIVVDAAELLTAMIEDVPVWNLQGNPSVEMIVAFWDGLNGAGYFVQSTPTIAFYPGKPMNVDFGFYSLGDIFGGVDWTWH
jgi:hypothetical protein